jgi:hypothetical protein
LYIWTPASVLATADYVRCAGKVGVDVGSTAMDGQTGTIQLDVSCATDLVPPQVVVVPTFIHQVSFAVTLSVPSGFQELVYKSRMAVWLPGIEVSHITLVVRQIYGAMEIYGVMQVEVQVTISQSNGAVASSVLAQIQSQTTVSISDALGYQAVSISPVSMSTSMVTSDARPPPPPSIQTSSNITGSGPPPSSMPPSNNVICTDDCIYSSNGACQDGGNQSILPNACSFGSDCSDCGPRYMTSSASPPASSYPPPPYDSIDDSGENAQIVAAQRWEQLGQCALLGYSAVGSAVLSVTSMMSAVGSIAVNEFVGSPSMILSVGRVLQQAFNLQRAAVRLPRKLSESDERTCYRDGGASRERTICIERGCVRNAGWVWLNVTERAANLYGYATERRVLADMSAAEPTTDDNCFAWVGPSIANMYSSGELSGGGCCDDVGISMESLINALLLCLLVLAVVVVLHLLYMARMRYVHRDLIRADQERLKKERSQLRLYQRAKVQSASMAVDNEASAPTTALATAARIAAPPSKRGPWYAPRHDSSRRVHVKPDVASPDALDDEGDDDVRVAITSNLPSLPPSPPSPSAEPPPLLYDPARAPQALIMRQGSSVVAMAAAVESQFAAVERQGERRSTTEARVEGNGDAGMWSEDVSGVDTDSEAGEEIVAMQLASPVVAHAPPGDGHRARIAVVSGQESDSNEDTGSDSNEDTGSDSNEDTGSDSNEDTGSDSNEDTGSDSNEDTGSESNEDTNSGTDTAPSTTLASSDEPPKDEPPKDLMVPTNFIRYATALIWPNPEVFVLVLFAPMLAGKATAVLAISHVTGCCTGWSCWLPMVVLICILYFLLRWAHVMWRFGRGTEAAERTYETVLSPRVASETPDPIYRALNRIRSACRLSLIDRFRGDYHVRPVDVPEPATTVRIVLRPFSYWGHDFRDEPSHGAHALYLLWLGDARGRRPWYMLVTLAFNVVLHIVLSLSALEAAYDRVWFVQGMLVLVLILLAMASMAVLRPTRDRLLSVQDALMYFLNLLSAFYAFAAYHISSYEEAGSLAAADALSSASVWLLVGFAAYDVFAVSFFNRLHAEGISFVTICAAVLAIPRNLLRTLLVILSTLLGKDLTCGLPADPYASKGHLLGSKPTLSKYASSVEEGGVKIGSPGSEGSPGSKHAAQVHSNSSVDSAATSSAPGQRGIKSYAGVVLTALLGGPACCAEREGTLQKNPTPKKIKSRLQLRRTPKKEKARQELFKAFDRIAEFDGRAAAV